jgi:hypothetical protein
VWDRHARGIRRVLDLPHLSAWWQARKDNYVPNFIIAIEQAPAAPPAPLAKAVIQMMVENARQPESNEPEG